MATTNVLFEHHRPDFVTPQGSPSVMDLVPDTAPEPARTRHRLRNTRWPARVTRNAQAAHATAASAVGRTKYFPETERLHLIRPRPALARYAIDD